MKTLNVMLKPASSLCNMRCLYCFYADEAEKRAVHSYGMMTEETADTIIDRVSEALSSGDAVQYIFQGGEPTLRGLSFFERFAERATARKDLRVSFSLQTNGLLLDDAWCDFLLKHRVLVGVSRLYDRANDPNECHDLIGDPAYAEIEKKFLMKVVDMMILSKGVRIEAHDMTPDTREGIEKLHPKFLDNFDIAYPLASRTAQQRLRDAGLDADYNEFVRNRPIKAHYGVYFFDEKK